MATEHPPAMSRCISRSKKGGISSQLWFHQPGGQVGGDQVWAYHPSCTAGTPPASQFPGPLKPWFFFGSGNFYPADNSHSDCWNVPIFNRKYIDKKSGSIFQPAMLVYQRVNDKVAGGDFKYLLFSPLLGEDEPNLTDIFLRG